MYSGHDQTNFICKHDVTLYNAFQIWPTNIKVY